MPARRIAFALLLVGTAAAAQGPPGFPPAHRELSLEQVQKAIAKLKGNSPAGLEDQFREMALRMFPDLKSDPARLDATIRGITGDPDKMSRLEEIAREHKATGKPPTRADLAPLLKDAPRPAGDSGPQPEPPPTPPPTPLQTTPTTPGVRSSASPGPTPGPSGGQPTPATPPPGEQSEKGSDRRTDEHRHGPGFSSRWGNPFFPPPPPEEVEKRSQREKAYRTLAGFWEQTLGPVNGTPAVQQFLREMIAAGDGITDADGNSVWAGLAADPGDGSGLADWFQKTTETGGWKWPALDLPSLDRGGDAGGLGNWSLPNLPERSWSGRGPSSWSPSGNWFGGSGGGSDGSWWPVVILGGVAFAAGAWWFLRRWAAADRGPVPLPGLGPWPIDPRQIADRDGVVRAFEYLGVLRCGPGAKAWNHAVLSAALGDLAADPDTARGLGRVYELARYTPAAEPLAPHDLDSARRFLCRLAGVAAP